MTTVHFFEIVPRGLDCFRGLDVLSRYAFGLIYGRWKVSKANADKFRDKFGIYCYFERRDIAAEMGVTLPTVRKAIKALEDADLLEVRRIGLGAPFRYYVTAQAEAFMRQEYISRQELEELDDAAALLV